MNLRLWLPVVVTVLYLLTAIDFARVKNWPLAGVWFSYFLANIFLSWIGFQGEK